MARKFWTLFKLLTIMALLVLAASPVSATPFVPVVDNSVPPYYLSDPDVADAPYTRISPLIDGAISPGEYATAGRISFSTFGGIADVLIVQDAVTLTIAIDSMDTTPFPFPSGGGNGPAFQLLFDTSHNGGAAPQLDDYRIIMDKGGTAWENSGTGVDWSGPPTGSWRAGSRATTWGWQAEFAISLSKLGIGAGTTQAIGLGISEVWTPTYPKDYGWPASVSVNSPDTWGHLISSSNWNSFYWKPGPWRDYAPSGMPDFSQKQDGWGMPGPTGMLWTHCGPVAMANSLWWFDSKFEPLPKDPPTPNDNYRLVKNYLPGLDDHDINNPIPFVDDLANNYFNTNNGIMGTNILSMTLGMQRYLKDHALWDDYSVTLVQSPTFMWVADEVMRSEDVILLLGFWEREPTGTEYHRIGGHYVTVSGVDYKNNMIAFSDPFLEAAELGLTPGRILDGNLITHLPIPGHIPDVHNDAGNVSHDVYPVGQSGSPGGSWGPMLYPWMEFMFNFGVNPHPIHPTTPWTGSPNVQVEVEYALAVSPFKYKASGYWDRVSNSWKSYNDYAPSGLPDFGQLQDNWISPITQRWSLCPGGA